VMGTIDGATIDDKDHAVGVLVVVLNILVIPSTASPIFTA